uniref:Uncharacterized protein n=2 Tax=Zea mays TaxID=4577 RepID=B4FGS5_MAIZE|nr:unknown [Zea mays]
MEGAMTTRSKHRRHEEDQEMTMVELRRGPWTLEEDNLLMNYIACHGEGRWNLLARCSGLKRTGKSCRLRWLNYLKPDIKRGNLAPEEQLLILELHSKWGNRWSRIAQHLPGRTDNEIKNYWRTRLLEKTMAAAAASTSGEVLLPPLPPPPQLHPSRVAGLLASSSSSPVQRDTSDSDYLPQRYHHHPVDPSPSASSTVSSSAALAPVPCFSELSWVDQYGYGPYYSYGANLDDGAGVFDDSAALEEGLGLDALDLGPADDSDVAHSDATLLDYLNSACAGGGTMMMAVTGGGGGVQSSGCGATGGADADYRPSPCTWRTDELGDPRQHQWGGGI